MYSLGQIGYLISKVAQMFGGMLLGIAVQQFLYSCYVFLFHVCFTISQREFNDISVSANMLIGEICCSFIVLNYKGLHTIIAIISEGKDTELFCIANDFSVIFNAMYTNYCHIASAHHPR